MFVQKKYINRIGIIKKDHSVDILMNGEEKDFAGDHDICKKFGCGKMLTINERRLSDHCINHQKKRQEGVTEDFMTQYFEKLDELIKPEIAA